MMHWRRALWVILAVLLLGAACLLLYRNGPGGTPFLPGCLFRKLTGLNCPGCGMTRATYATLHGDLGRAFRLNPLGMILLPIALLGISLEVAGWVGGKPLPFTFKLKRNWGWILLYLILAYWVLRNLPWWPFTLLAP